MAGQGGCNFNEEYKKINGCGMKHFNIRAAIASLFSGSGRNNRNGLPEKTDFSDEDARYMRMAIDLSVENIDNGGGPFGAVIVRDGEVIATGVNRVVPNNDPTAHAEVNAIRNACQKLDTFQLEGCTVYSSCEPCPMCLSAIIWSNISTVYFACTKNDAANIGFRDDAIYEYLKGSNKSLLNLTQIDRLECLELFKNYNKTIY